MSLAPADTPSRDLSDPEAIFRARLSPRLAEVGPTRERLRRWLVVRRVAVPTIDDVVLIMSELATNAVRAAGHRVEVEVLHADTGVTVEVRDDGPGLPAATAASLAARAPETHGRHGLLLVARISDELSAASDESGTLVRARCPTTTTVRPTWGAAADAACDPDSRAAPGTPASG